MGDHMMTDVERKSMTVRVARCKRSVCIGRWSLVCTSTRMSNRIPQCQELGRNATTGSAVIRYDKLLLSIQYHLQIIL